ncbi:hypothetical protein GCM10010388_69470 [Streptomyces mauvecolor]
MLSARPNHPPSVTHRVSSDATASAVSSTNTRRSHRVTEVIGTHRARVKELELEREILRRAAKYFAAETSW